MKGARSAGWHPVLRPMRDTCARMRDAGEPRADVLLDAITALNDRRSFWHPAAHPHFRREGHPDEVPDEVRHE